MVGERPPGTWLLLAGGRACQRAHHLTMALQLPPGPAQGSRLGPRGSFGSSVHTGVAALHLGKESLRMSLCFGSALQGCRPSY